jgi:hypothetical protein
MSRVTKHRCEKCSAETEDVPNTFGWIVIVGDDMRSYGNVTIEVTATKNSCSYNIGRVCERQPRYDFCSTSCLVNWISCKIDAAQQRQRDYLADQQKKQGGVQ